jgi:hypothetical protein
MIVTTFIERIRIAYEGYPQWALFVGGWGAVALTFAIAIIFSTKFREKREEIDVDEG